MKLLEKAKGKIRTPKVSEEKIREFDIDIESDAVAETGWNELAEGPVVEAEPKFPRDDIITRKIIGVMATKNVNLLNQRDLKIDPTTRDWVINQMASGRIGEAEERKIFSCIKGPLQNIEDAPKVVETLSTKQEKRILATLGVTGFENWESVNAGDIRKFIKDYPTPMDFEEISNDFLDAVGESNGAEKRKEYERAMASFKRKIYGDKQIYWEHMLQLNNEVEVARDRNERERSSEWVPGAAGVWQTSRGQAKDGKVRRENIFERKLWADSTCEDAYFSRPGQQLYGVFDGAGGIKGGRLAAQISAEVLREFSDKNDYMDLEKVLEETNRRVGRNAAAGIATATIAFVEGSKLVYASVGDSRLYIVDKHGKARQITTDECLFGNQLTNYIGESSPEHHFRVEKMNKGVIDLQQGDRVVLCTDGITGDRGNDLMSNIELGNIIRNSHGALDASKNLVAAARKNDDRTALVFVPKIEG